jgi:hypothetical protein
MLLFLEQLCHISSMNPLHLYLDTTFLNPAAAFPSKQEQLDQVR